MLGTLSLSGLLASLPAEARAEVLATATPAELRALETDARETIKGDLIAWAYEALAQTGYVPAAHHMLLLRELQAVAEGRNDRLMVLMPPGSAKTTYTSRIFPAWYLAQKNDRMLLAASHTALLAETNSGAVQRYIEGHTELLGVSLLSKKIDLWRASNGSEFRAAGVGGSIAGFRADVGLIDDPVRSREEADSPTIREKTWRWYEDDFLTRLKPGAAIVLVMTRWHVDDLGGRILRDAAAGGKPWRVLRLPMEAGTDDPLGRHAGDLLWPDWFTEDMVTQAKRNRRTWASLYQQQPYIEGGQILQRQWWKPWTDPLPTPDFIIISVDPAYTKEAQNDPSACTVWWTFPDKDGRQATLMRYAWAKRLEFPELVEEIAATYEAFAIKGVPVRLLVESKASGLSVVQELRKRVEDIPVWAENVKGDKIARAYSCQSIFEAGRVYAVANVEGENEPEYRGWASAVIEEVASFPAGEHDDLTDTVTQALRHMIQMGVQFLPADDPSPPPYDTARAGQQLYGAVARR